MPKGEYDTPGPYSRQGFCLLGRINETEHMELAEFVPRLEDCDRDQLVDLLNRGTRFEGMLEALKAIVGDDMTLLDVDDALMKCRAAIAKAEGNADAQS